MPRGVYERTKPSWNKGLTKETDERVARNAEHTQQTVRDRYGVGTVLQSQEVLDKIADDRHSGKLAQKASETKADRYGDPHYNNIEKQRITKMERYNDPYFNNMEKMYQTKREHKTFNTSKPEEELYLELKKLYGFDDVIQQYSDPRYPYQCDFYIPSEDLFIELNYHQSHGLHPFNPNNQEDVELVNSWREKQNIDGPKNQYWGYEKVFTKTDPEKLNCAIKNKLNYLVIYRNGLEIKI